MVSLAGSVSFVVSRHHALMQDKVLNMIRETLLHDNSLEEFSFDFDRATARLDLSQPREDDEYPDYSLRLTFAGIREFHGGSTPGDHLHKTDLLGIDCSRVADAYHATVTAGHTGESPAWTVRLVFTGMSYERE